MIKEFKTIDEQIQILKKGRSRYLILYLPYFCMASTFGIKTIIKK